MTKKQRYRNRLRARAAGIHGTRCRFCGTTESLEYAHTSPTDLEGEGRGSIERYLDVIRFAICYIRLCRECHRKFDKRDI